MANLAAGRPYTLAPNPNFALCGLDVGRTILTDGVETGVFFWTAPTTTGWQNDRPACIRAVIDLGTIQPVEGVTWRTAAGVGGVNWPEGIDLYFSDDGARWWHGGELVELSGLGSTPPPSGYAVHEFTTDRLTAHGRYVCLQVSTDRFAFTDEVSVWSGDAALLNSRREGSGVLTAGLEADFWQRRGWRTLKREVLADLTAAEALLSGLHPVDGAYWQAEIDNARLDVAAETFAPRDRAVPPYSEAHDIAFAVRGASWVTAGITTRVWAIGKHDPGDAAAVPGSALTALSLSMLRSEQRSVAFCASRALPGEADARVTATGFPGSVQLRECEWTATAAGASWTASLAGVAKASALRDCRTDGQTGWHTRLACGMHRRLWLTFDTAGVAAGDYPVTVKVAVDGVLVGSFTVSVHVGNAVVPAQLALACSGWDYSEKYTYGITAQNITEVLAFLRSYHVDCPWADSGAMPFGVHDGSGALVTPPATTVMDLWLTRWPPAVTRWYCVLVNLTGTLSGAANERRIREWIAWWVAYLATKGVSSDRLILMISDEPNTDPEDAGILSYAVQIHAGAPSVRVFVNPVRSDPTLVSPTMLAECDLLCPQRIYWGAARASHEAVYLPYQTAGAQMAFYSCSGPVRSMDPYSYHRMQSWECFKYGAVMCNWWAFGDDGGASSWYEPAILRTMAFTPQFLSAEGCVTSVHMEGLRDGLLDYETLTILRAAADAAEAGAVHPTEVAEARTLLSTGVDSVVLGAGAGTILWASAKSRTAADALIADAIALIDVLTS